MGTVVSVVHAAHLKGLKMKIYLEDGKGSEMISVQRVLPACDPGIWEG